MKYLKGVAFAFLMSVLVIACNKKAEQKTENTEKTETTEKTMAENAKMETANLEIEGMTCEMGCAKTIEGELNSLKGVKTASVDFDKKTATVLFDANVENLASLTKTVEATAGGDVYKVTASNVVVTN